MLSLKISNFFLFIGKAWQELIDKFVCAFSQIVRNEPIQPLMLSEFGRRRREPRTRRFETRQLPSLVSIQPAHAALGHHLGGGPPTKNPCHDRPIVAGLLY